MLCARIELGSSCEWPSVARTVQRYRPPGQGTRLDAAHTAPESQRQVLPPGFLHLTRKHVRTDTVVHHPRMCARVRVRKYVHEASYSIAGHAFSTATRDCNPRPPPCDIPSRTRILSVKPHAQTQHMGRQLGSTARVCSRQPGGSHSCRSVSPGGAVGPSGCSVCPHTGPRQSSLHAVKTIINVDCHARVTSWLSVPVWHWRSPFAMRSAVRMPSMTPHDLPRVASSCITSGTS